MPSTDAPNWWADVQQEREDLAGPGRRPADDWLGEDIDFVPRRRMTRERTPAAPIEGRLAIATSADADLVAPRGHAGAGDPLHGVFVPAAPHAPVREAVSRTIELSTSEGPVPVAEAAMAHELAHLSAADDPFATPPPPAGARRTVQIKGRPAESRMVSGAHGSQAQRHRGRTTSDRVGPRPDRIALWAVALGAILILLAAMTSSSQAAVHHAQTSAPAVSAKVAHATPHTPLRAIHRHR
jgi:hypothetical protein